MTTITRTVRFRKDEAELIDQFLSKNPVLDFSTLARLSISRFIKNPDLQLEPVEIKTQKAKRRLLEPRQEQ
ncbi:hypothetical protein K2X30_10210 [bacterium]|nr:hypothetical protein [bacterium]